MAVQAKFHPDHYEKELGALNAERIVKRITFDKSEAKPGETLYVYVPQLLENEVILPGSLALRFNIDLSGGYANNFLVQNVTRGLIDKLTVKFSNGEVQDTNGYDIHKIFENLFVSQEEGDDKLFERIQKEDQNKIRSNSGDKKTSGADAENMLAKIYGNKYRIRWTTRS